MLGFDTATDDTVVGATLDGAPTFEATVPPEGRPVHGTRLLELVEEASATLGGWEHVDRIAVGVGPGSFTGIRIGLATAAGLASSTGIATVGVSTLAAMAISIADGTGAERVAPVIDARRGQVFGGIYAADGTELEEPVLCEAESLVERVPALARHERPLPVAGSGAVRFRDELLLAGLVPEPVQSAVHHLGGRSLCQLAALATRTGPETLRPLYLRPPDAQLWLERDRSKSGGRDPG